MYVCDMSGMDQAKNVGRNRYSVLFHRVDRHLVKDEARNLVQFYYISYSRIQKTDTVNNKRLTCMQSNVDRPDVYIQPVSTVQALERVRVQVRSKTNTDGDDRPCVRTYRLDYLVPTRHRRVE